MPEVNEAKYAKLFNDSINFLDHALNSVSQETELSQRETSDRKIAMSVINSYPRHKLAQASMVNSTLAVLEATAESKEEYRQLVRDHLPRIGALRPIPQILDATRRTASDLQKKLNDTVASHAGEVKELKDRIGELEFELELEKEKKGTTDAAKPSSA